MANNYEPGSTTYSSKQKAVSFTLGVACTIPLTTTAAMANAPSSASGWQTHASFTPMSHAAVPTTATAGSTGFQSLHGQSTAIHHNQAVHQAVSSLFHSAVLRVPNLPAAGGADLNLASTKLAFLAGNLANFQDLTIDVGGHKQTVTLNSKLTGAELVAAQQVLANGTQTIKLTATGAAAGGTVTLNDSFLSALDHSLGGSIGSLTIARGVQVVDSLSTLSLGGNLANYGSLLTASGTAGSSDTVSANRIVNAYGGTIGSYTGGNGMFAADPILNALTSISNAGTISSAGNLTLTAPVIYNTAAHGSAPSITAQQNVNINTQNLDNSGGVIAALTGNVNIAGGPGLNMLGNGGTIQAANGNVNFSAADADINISGGNVQSQAVNLDAGKGTVLAQFEDVTGELNASACNIHVGADTENLHLGVVKATDDPTFTNTGNLIIDSNLAATGGEALTLIAGGNIVSGAGNKGLDTSNAAGGGALTLIAGASFTPFSTNNPPTGSGVTVTVTKGSSTGGFIDLTGGGVNPVTKIDTSSAAGKAGSIQLVAYAGSVAGSGAITVPSNVTINAAGSSAANNGDVSIIAGAKSGTAISTGAIVGANVTVDTAAPVLSKTAVSFDSKGAQSPGSSITGATTANAANATLGSVTSSALNINTAGSATVTNTTTPLNLGTIAVGKTGTLKASTTTGGIVVNSTIAGGTATLTTTGAGAVTTGGKGSVNTTNFNLNTGTALSTVTTNTANLVVNTAGGGVNLTQGVNAINISGKLGGAGNLTVKSAGQVTFNAPTFLAGNTLDVTTTGKAGIKINAPIFLGAGTANLTTDQGVILESVGNVLTATNVTLTSNVSIGSKTAPFLTNASNLTVNDIGAKSVAYVTDQNIGTLTFNGDGGATPGSLFLTSSANQLLVGSANYANVSLTDSVANGKGIDFNIGVGKLGTGAAKTTFTVNSGSFITDSSGATLNGATITLTGTKGVGTKAQPIIVNSPNLVLNSSQGDVWVVDGVATTVNGSAWLKGTFSVVDKAPSGVGITVGKAIGGGNIILSTGGFGGSIALTGTTGTSTTSSLTLDSATTVTTKGAINAAGITFQAVGPVTIGGPVGSPTTDINFKVTGPGGIAVNGAISGNNIGIDSAGPVTITKAITGSGAGSSVNITGAASTPTGNAVVIGAAITGETISVGLKTGAQGNIAVNAAVGNANTVSANISAVSTVLGGLGSVTGTGLVTGTTVSLGASNSVGTAAKLFNTAAGTLNVTSGPGGTDGAFVQQKGNLVLGSSTDSNFVLKVTGNLDVAGVVTSPSININATGTTTIDGTIQNTSGKGPTSGAISITSGGPLTITGTGKLITTNDTAPVTVNVKGLTTVNGTLAVNTLNLTSPSGLTVGPTGVMADGVDNFTTTGPIDVEGQLGKLDNSTVFNITTTGTFTIGGSAVVNGGGLIQGGQIANYGVFTGAVKMIGTGAGNAFSNFNTITGGNITITTTNPAGVIFNAPGAIIQAVAPNSTSPSPTLNLNTYGVNNQGTISAVGTFQGAQGILNITSPGALTISGVDGGFKMGAYSAVNLKAAGNVTVGGIVGGVNSNPFSNFNAANELGQFTLNTTGNFSSTMPGVSVLTNNTGSFGGVINLQAASVLYNGVGTAPVFALNAIGAGLGVSGGKSPVTLTLTGAQGITIGNAPGNFSVNVEGFDNTSKSTFSTTGALKIDTSAFNVHYTSLLLSGITGVLITGDLNEGTKAGTNVTINTTSTTPFLIGGATTNGMTGLSLGQGLTADTLTLNTPGGVTLGTKAQGQIIVAPSGVTLNGQNLAVNQGSDIVSKAVTVNVPSGNTTYTNLNTDGGISASALTINDNGGIVTLVSGDPSKTQSTFTLGPVADGTLAHITGGVFTINAQSISFQKNLHFDASSPVNGGGVHINLSTQVNITVGNGNGQISADVSSGNNYDDPVGSGKFDISTGGNIVADLNAVKFSINNGGDLSLSAGGTLLVSNVYSKALNLYNFNSSSTSAFLMAGATVNGITDATPTYHGGRIQASTAGDLITNGAQFDGTALNLTTPGTLDISNNANIFFHVFRAPTPTGFANGELTFTAASIKTNTSLGLPTVLQVDGGSNSGGTVVITTSDVASATPVTIGLAKGNFAIDVSNLVPDINGVYHAGAVTISNPAALSADLQALFFHDSGNKVDGVGGNLSLTSGFAKNLTIINADKVDGLRFSTANFSSGSTTTTFFLSNAPAGGNGFFGVGGSTALTAGKIVVDAGNTTIDTTGFNSVTHELDLNASTIKFGAGQVIAVLPDGLTVGTTGLPPGKPTGSGGTIRMGATTYDFSAGSVTLQAKGDGTTANSVGGTIGISYSGTTALAVDKTTFNFDVSNANKDNTQKAGEVDISSGANISLDGQAFTFNTVTGTGGTLSVNAPNILVTNLASLNQGTGFGLDSVSFVSNGPNPFAFGSAATNGFADATSPTLTAKSVVISNLGGDINTNGGAQITGNSLALNASGQITFQSGGTITALQDPTSKSGGSITITAGSVAYDKVGAAVTFVAKSSGAAATAGSVLVNVTGSNALTIGAGGMAFDVSNSGGGSAGSVTVNNGGDMIVDASAINFGNTKNGSLSLTAAGAVGNLLISNVGTLKTGSGLGLDKIAFTSNSNNDFQFGGAPVGGNGLVGAANLQATEIDIVNNGVSGVGGINTNGGTLSAHTLLLSTPNAVTLAPAGLKVLEDPNSHDGGSMTINAGSLVGASGVTLSAKGTTGTGGNITLAITSTNQLVVGAGGLTLDVSTAGTTGGNVFLTNAGDISVDGSAISYGKSGGGLTVTGNNLLITKVASLSAFPLKTIALTSLSSSDFVFGGATTNGFGDVGAQTLKADSVTVNVNVLGNLTGGIDTTGATTVSAHTLVLSTLNTVTLKSGGTIAAVADATTGDGGSITINAGALLINGAGGSTLTANATTGKGGSILVNVGTTSDLIIGSGGLNFSVTNAATFNGGSVTVNNGGGIIADASKINLGSNFGANPGPKLILNANGILAVSNLLATAALGLDTLTLTSDSAQTFSLGGAALGTNGVNDALPNYKAANITIANAGGAIINGGSKGLNGTTSVTLTASTDIGAVGTPIVITGSGGGVVKAGGDAYLATSGTSIITSGAAMGTFSVVGTAGDLTVGSAASVSAASVLISYTTTNANTVTLGSLEGFNGAVNVQSSAQHLVVVDNAVITSENGDITLASGQAGSNIAIGNGVFIHGTGPLIGGGFGNIFIYTGAAPTGLVAGITPANADVYSYPGNTFVTFGAAGNPSGTITVAAKPLPPPDIAQTVLAGLARKLVFNEGAGVITVGYGGRIIADPPGLLPVFGSSTTAVSSGPVSASSAPVSVQAVPVATSVLTAPTTPVAATTPVNAGSAPTVSAPAIASISAPTITSNVTAAPSVVAASAAVAGITSAGMTGLLSGLSNSATASYAGGGYTLNGEVSRDVKRTGAGHGSVGGTSSTAHRSMVRGAQLLAPLENTVVETPFGSVSVAAQSVAMIISSDKGLTVYNLHDGHKNAVVINNGGAPIALLPGCTVTLTRGSAATFEEINPAKFVGYRRMMSRTAENNGKLYQAEFEIMSLIRGLPALKDLLSSDDAKTRKTIESMMKTAAILMQLAPSKEPYKLYLTPELTAYAASAQH